MEIKVYLYRARRGARAEARSRRVQRSALRWYVSRCSGHVPEPRSPCPPDEICRAIPRACASPRHAVHRNTCLEMAEANGLEDDKGGGAFLSPPCRRHPAQRTAARGVHQPPPNSAL